MRRDLGLGLLLAALTLAVYWPVRTHDFIAYDDPQFVTENTLIQSGLSWETLVYACTTPVVGNWHPVTILSHALDCELFGLNPGAHHLVNALLHALNAGLLFVALQQLTSSMARATLGKTKDRPGRIESLKLGGGFAGRNFVIAALFALHPLRVESVAWLAERKDLLAGFFFLLTLWAYADYVQKAESGKAETGANDTHHGAPVSRFPLFLTSLSRFPLFSIFCFSLGLMSKPMVVTLPFVLLLLDYWPLGRVALADFRGTLHPSPEGRVSRVPVQQAAQEKRDSWNSSFQGGQKRDSRNSSFRGSKVLWLIYEKIPFFLLSAVACWITLGVQKAAGAMEIVQGISWPERLANAITSYTCYLGKMFWPRDLAVIYPHPAKHYFLTDAWPGWEIGVAALLLIMISLFCVTQLTQRPYLAVGWYWFLGTLVPVIGLVQVGEQAMADRYTYIPLIGPVIALVWGFAELARGAGVAQTSSLLYRRIPFCTAQETARIPDSDKKASIPAQQINRSGWWRRQMLASGFVLALLALLVTLTRHQLAYWQNSVTLFEHTLSVTTDNPSAHFALGVGLETQGQANQAMVQYRVAAAIDPHYTKAFYNMGQILRKAGYWRPAAEAYLAAARCNPTDLSTQLNLASVLPHLGRTREAIEHFNKALELDPNSLEGLNNLAWLLCTSPGSDLRDGARAVQLAQRACALSGFQTPVFLGTLAAAYAEAGRFTEAVTTAQNAVSLAAQAGDTAAASKNRELAELYRAGKPYRAAP